MTLPFLDRMRFHWRLWRARRRLPFRHERELGEPLLVDGFDLDFPEGEAAYNGIGIDGDGVVWFAVSTKSRDTGARLYTFENDRVRRVFDFVPEPGTIPQGKIHVDLLPHGDGILGATHIGYYDPASKIETPGEGHYPGGIFFIAKRDGTIQQLAQAPAGEGIIAMSSNLFALTWPSGLLLHLGTNYGPVMGRVSSRAQSRDLPHPAMEGDGSTALATTPVAPSRICRSIVVEPESGTVFWSDDDGRILRFPNEHVATTPRKEMWRKMVWSPKQRAFIGALWNSATLIRFDPFSLQCDELGNLGGPPATLAFTLVDDEIHAIINGPGVLRDGRIQLARSTAYVRGNTTSGPLRLKDGRWVMQVQSLVIQNGVRYAVAWVENARGAEEIVFIRF